MALTANDLEQIKLAMKGLISELELAIGASLENFATKDDLVRMGGRFATKDDLERFATKVDLEQFATKSDLERFVTKDDLERFATKDDLERFATKIEFERMESRIITAMGLVERDAFERLDDHERRIGRLERREAAA